MSTETVGIVLLRMLTDQAFAKAVIADPDAALAGYRGGLTDEEFKALSTCIPPSSVEALLDAPYVGAWQLLSNNIGELNQGTRDALNTALAQRSGSSGAIPVTGT
ncbi:hypothetical protein [Sinorhizobium medicae]|uniref:hypothetical protein n=1 Tax=Sinorhizobium medicae TaxID=110321 RepID=UPI001AAF553E|nr:hypothetical protein [Sinorhizobium medicae]MDW9359445.1 hypothetical protein [Sinorhizobium meliloti]MBO1965318.1 hypothetical protein [Sinorhizobium medicae]MDW9943440.1 hypothetical protein [Sinorhizobium meliloti]WQO56787.1 hypothetical protein U8C36_35740 [Sinorhizobium medicae]WQP41134.1 hypothetical protein U8C38_26725 [Sinorhizobium medicae]